MPDVRQFADVRVGDVLGDMLRRIGEPCVQPGPLGQQDQDRRVDLSEHLGVGWLGPLVGHALLDLLHQEREETCLPVEVLRIQGSELVVRADEAVEDVGRVEKPAVDTVEKLWAMASNGLMPASQ